MRFDSLTPTRAWSGYCSPEFQSFGTTVDQVRIPFDGIVPRERR